MCSDVCIKEGRTFPFGGVSREKFKILSLYIPQFIPAKVTSKLNHSGCTLISGEFFCLIFVRRGHPTILETTPWWWTNYEKGKQLYWSTMRDWSEKKTFACILYYKLTSPFKILSAAEGPLLMLMRGRGAGHGVWDEIVGWGRMGLPQAWKDLSKKKYKDLFRTVPDWWYKHNSVQPWL